MFLVASEGDDQVDVRVDGLAVLELDGLVELELDRAVAGEVETQVRVAGSSDPGLDERRERAVEGLGTEPAARGIGAVGPELVRSAVDHDPAVGVAQRRVLRAVGDGPRAVAAVGGLVFPGDAENQVAPALRLAENIRRDGDLTEDLLDDKIGRGFEDRRKPILRADGGSGVELR